MFYKKLACLLLFIVALPIEQWFLIDKSTANQVLKAQRSEHKQCGRAAKHIQEVSFSGKQSEPCQPVDSMGEQTRH